MFNKLANICYNISYQNKETSMALIIKNKKVVYIAPPKKLTIAEKKILEETPVNHELIKRATSRKYNIVETC